MVETVRREDHPMEYRHLGRLGLRVSPLCLGTMNFGPETSERDAHAIMDRALDLGINFVDTANVYGRRIAVGTTETIVGNWLASGGGRREKVVLATKVYGEMGPWPNESRLSARHIRDACDASLRRLQTDHIDLYQMHHIDRAAPWDELWQAFETLVQQGKILYVGSSNFAGWHIARANEIATGRHFLGLSSEQCLYNLVDRMSELEVLPACEAYGMGVIPWSPLASGLLGGVLEKIEGGRRASQDVQDELATHRDAIEAYEKLCADLGEKPADVALAWLLANPVVTAPIVGPRTLDQLEGTMRALELALEDDVLARLEEIFPGPGGAAPEAYAW
jgi:aryl-alcohol dehydrogenase-like predicted oxidoreductase